MPPARRQAIGRTGKITSFFQKYCDPSYNDEGEESTIVLTSRSASTSKHREGSEDATPPRKTTSSPVHPRRDSREIVFGKVSPTRSETPLEIAGNHTTPPKSSKHNALTASPMSIRTKPLAQMKTVPVRRFSLAPSSGRCSPPLDEVPNISLGSFHSGSVPASSGTSKRIIKDGLEAVANSDSGMSGDDSSDEELADPSSFFVNKRRKLSPPAENKSTSVAKKPSLRLLNPDRQKGFRSSPKASPPRKKYKNSLSDLVRQHAVWKASEADIANMETAIEESKKRQAEADAQEEIGVDVGDNIFAEGTGDGEADERMLMALQRTEAMRNHQNYHFFLDDQPLFDNSPFPVDAIPDRPWARLLTDDTSRKHACISGFIAEIAAVHPFPVALTNWFAHQLLHEPNETLCGAYVGILQVCSTRHESMSDTIASLSSLYKTRSFFEQKWSEQVRKTLPRGLAHVMRVVSFCAPASDTTVPDSIPMMSIAAFLDLALINVDDNVRQDSSLALEVASCIETLLDTLSEDSFEKLIPEVRATLYHPGDLSPLLRNQVIAALPFGTTRACDVRRRLALEFFSPTKGPRESTVQDWMSAIWTALQTKPEFHINERTDYELLSVLVEVLDIAISSGFTPYDELHPPDPLQPVGLFSKPPPVTHAAKLHNEQVDAIIWAVNRMTSRIRDSGTSHLRRTEVKSAMERLVARLEFSVRTRRKPAKNVFGGPTKQQMRFDRSMLERAGSLGDGAGDKGVTGTGAGKLSTAEHVEEVVHDDVADLNALSDGSEVEFHTCYDDTSRE